MNLVDYTKLFQYIRDLPHRDEEYNILDEAKKVIDKWMVKNCHITKESLKEFISEIIGSRVLEVGVEQLIPQYNLAMQCLEFSGNFGIRVVSVPFKYFDYDECFKVGNFYVPHFYIHRFIDFSEKIISCYPERVCLEKNLDTNKTYSSPLLKSDEETIIDILNQLPFAKENIHVGFLFDDVDDRIPNYAMFRRLVQKLDSLGYDTYGNHEGSFTHIEFGWDDSWSKTITVIVEFKSYEKSVIYQTERFLTFDGEFQYTYVPGRLVYISIFQEDVQERNKRVYGKTVSYGLNFNQLHSEWLSIPDYPFFLFPIHTYYPKNSPIATDYDKSIQKLIWEFKDGGLNRGIFDNRKTVLEECVEFVEKVLICTFGSEDCKKLTFLCVPPSSQSRYITRYKEFSSLLSSRLGMHNGYDYITYTSDTIPKHLGGSGHPNFSISSKIKGKNIIIFDDIFTTGRTLFDFSNRISKEGGWVVGGIVLGITEHDKNYENKICYGYHGLFDLNNTNIW